MRILATLSLLVLLGVGGGTPAFAEEPLQRITRSAGVDAVPGSSGLVAQARSLALESAVGPIAQELPTVSANPDKGKFLLAGLAGVGAAVAGSMMLTSDCNRIDLCGKQRAGAYLLSSGAVLAGWGLWKGFK